MFCQKIQKWFSLKCLTNKFGQIADHANVSLIQTIPAIANAANHPVGASLVAVGLLAGTLASTPIFETGSEAVARKLTNKLHSLAKLIGYLLITVFESSSIIMIPLLVSHAIEADSKFRPAGLSAKIMIKFKPLFLVVLLLSYVISGIHDLAAHGLVILSVVTQVWGSLRSCLHDSHKQ